MRKLLLLIALLTPAATPADPDIRELFEKARMMADQNRNLSEAIRIFAQVVSLARAERSLGAQAQYQEGLLYERLGRKPEAQNAFRAVLSNFADQADVVALAQVKLPPSIPEMRTRTVWSGDDAIGATSVSPDGRLLALADRKTGNLLVHDVETNETRVLVKSPGLPIGAGFPTISRDGKWLIFSWQAEIRAIGIDGSGQRAIYPAGPVGPRVHDCDGKVVLAAFGNELRSITMADGASRAIPVSPRWNGSRTRISPDGRYVAYAAQLATDKSAVETRVIALATGVDLPLIANPNNDVPLDWSADGSRLVLLSMRSNEAAIWAVSMADGRAQGELERVQPAPGPIDGVLGITRQDSAVYSIYESSTDVYLSQVDPGGRSLSAPKALSDRFPHAKWSSAWSPDDQSVVYLSGGKLRLHDLAGGTDRDVLPELRQATLILGWPDAHSVLVQGVAKGPKPGTYRVNVDTGAATLVLPEMVALPSFSHDAGTVYLLGGKSEPGAILSQDVAGGEKKTVFSQSGLGDLADPNFALSPDEKLLAFRIRSADGYDSLEVIPAGGGEARVLLRIRDPEHFGRRSVTWSADSQSIFVSRVGTDHSEIWRVPLDGGPALATGVSMPGIINHLQWSHRGSQITFTNDQSAHQVWMLENFLPRAKGENR